MTKYIRVADLYEISEMNFTQEYSIYDDYNYGIHYYSGNDSSLYFDAETSTFYEMSGYIIIILCVVYIMTFVLTVVGNAMVCYTIYSLNDNSYSRVHSHSQRVPIFFRMALSVNDIIIAVVCIPLVVFSKIVYNYWPFGSWACTTVSVLQNTIILCRGFILIVMTKECHTTTKNPYGQRISKIKAKLLIFGSVIVALILSCPLFLYTKTKNFPTVFGPRLICVEEWPSQEISHIYSICIVAVQYIIPMITLAACYAHIGIIVMTSKVPGDSNVTNRRLQKRQKTIKLMVIVVISFALCWAPISIINITGNIMSSVNRQKFVRIIWLFSHCLAIGNSGINPILYCWMKKSYRKGYRDFANRILCRTIKKQYRHRSNTSSFVRSQV